MGNILGDIWSGAKKIGAKDLNIIEHPIDNLKSLVHGATDTLGLTHAAPPDPSQGPDAQAERDFADTLRKQYTGVNPVVDPRQVNGAPTADQQYANVLQRQAAAGGPTAGDVDSNALLRSAATGAAPSAAENLYRQGADEAARSALGTAATLQGSNPGAALRAGMAGVQTGIQGAAAGAGALRANEMAAARGQYAGAVQGQDVNSLNARAQYADALAKQQGAQITADQSNQAADLQNTQISNNYKLGLGTLASNATTAPLNAAVANQQAQIQQNAANTQGAGALYGAIGAAVVPSFKPPAPTTSDARAKTDIKPRSYADVLADEVQGVSYEYKNGIEDGGRHFGVIAQDLEKVYPGLVKSDASGLKKVDTGHLSLANTGVLAELAKRLKAVEERSR